MQNVVDVYNKIESTDTVGSFMGKLGITEPLIHKLVETEIVELMMTEKGKVTKKTGLPTSGNELAAYVSFDEGEQKYVVKNFGAMMDEIEKQNPYLHNQIISGMTNLLEENQRRDGGFKVDRNTYDNIKSLISTSNARDDSVIAAVSKENPNSTAFAEAMWDTYGRIMDTKSPTDKDVKK